MTASVDKVGRRRATSTPRERSAFRSPYGSSSATVVSVSQIAQKELRNHVGEVLRRAEAGETLTVTVAGRPVAELGPVHRRRWVSGATLADIWRGVAPRGLGSDLDRLPAGVIDPFAS